MAYSDISADLFNDYEASLVGTGVLFNFESNYLGGSNTYGFAASGYSGYDVAISENYHKALSYANCRIGVTVPDDYSVNVRVNYICSGESRYDYGVFGKSGVTLTSTNYTSTTAYHKTCCGETPNMLWKTVDYHLTASTHIDIMYRKDGSADREPDRLIIRIEAEAVNEGGGSDLTYYYYGFAVKFYGYTTVYSANTYLINPSLTTPYFDDGATTTYQSGITDGYVVYWTSGATDDDPMYLEPGYWSQPRFKADGHSWVSTDITYQKIELATSPLHCIVSPTTIITTHHQAVYLRQYLYGLAIHDIGMMYSHVNLSVYNMNTTQTLTGKTGNNGIATRFSSAFTMNGSMTVGSISGQRKSKTGSTVYHSFPTQTLNGFSVYSNADHPKVDYWCVLALSPPTNSGMVVTGKALKDVAPEANIPATGEALQRALKKSDWGQSAWGSFQVDDDSYPPHDYEVFCWAMIQQIGSTAYFTREDENIGPIWSGNTYNIHSGYYINASGGSYTLTKLISVPSNSIGQELLFSGSTYKIADIGTFSTNKTVTIDLSNFNRNNGLSIGVCAFSPGCNRITQFDAVSYYGTLIYVSSGTSTTPIQSIAYEDIDGELNEYFTDPCDMFNGSVSLNSVSNNFTFNAKASNHYYLYLRPVISVVRAMTIAGDITCRATFSIAQGASQIFVGT